MKTNSQLLTTKPKKTKTNKLSKQLEQEQNHRNVIMEGYQRGSGRGREWVKVQKISNINGR